ncbi:ABC transporter, ATP-binding protein, partial [Listeria monocytogenes FSL F2-208]
MRLRLAQFINMPVNTLILDEPTNHLDIASREILEEAIRAFSGTIITVSHDRYFIDQLCSKVIWLENKQLTVYEGNYSYATSKRR